MRSEHAAAEKLLRGIARSRVAHGGVTSCSLSAIVDREASRVDEKIVCRDMARLCCEFHHGGANGNTNNRSRYHAQDNAPTLPSFIFLAFLFIGRVQ